MFGGPLVFVLNQTTGIKYLVKYYRDADRNFYKKGSFRFGTLEQLRTYEGRAHLLSDYEEGKPLDVVQGTAMRGQPGSQFFSSFEYRGIKITNSVIGPSTGDEPHRPRGILINREINAHVMCFTIGSYSPSHHNFMAYGGLNPDGSFYDGDETLTWAALIDLKKFFGAIGSKLGNAKATKGLPVVYGERRRVLTPEQLKIADTSGIDGNDVLRATFTKKTKFEGEQEYRILLYDSDGSILKSGDGPLKVCCTATKNSIIRHFKLGGG